MPRTNHSTRLVASLPASQASLVADFVATRATVARLASRISVAKRPRTATARKLADASARLAWQANLLAEWYADAQEALCFLRNEQDEQRKVEAKKIEAFDEELEALAAQMASYPDFNLSSFEKQFCHPADMIDGFLADIDNQ